MKYMLMMHTPGSGPYQIAKWPKKDIEAHIGFMIDFRRARRTRSSDDRPRRAGRKARHRRRVSGDEGFLAGYWIVDVDSPERAYAIAAEASAAPGSSSFAET